ncbi:MAG: 2-hydroxychromene-2-carboxylate isomerase [Myxococcales bacterium]|nr:2-hydroxychromene-2-carboxylate isomerase [Myxococcales bacterium]
MPAPIEFFFDFISPYAYLAWQRIHPLAERHGRAVLPRPVLFAGLLNHWGQLGPAEIPPKRLWTFKQVSRRAARLGVPLQPPPSHPFNPLNGLRLASLEKLDDDARRRLIDLLYRATWGGGPGIADPATVAALLDAEGFDGAALIRATQDPAAKQAVVVAGQQAIAAGVFGVPTMLVDGELFWGDDSFEDLDAFLRGEDPLDSADLARWTDLPATAQRKA